MLALVKQAMGFVTVGRSVVVERERVQVEATDGITAARAAAESGARSRRQCRSSAAGSAPWCGPPWRGRGIPRA